MQILLWWVASSVPFNDADKWSSQIVQRYNTFVASALWNAIPGKLDILGDYVIALATEANNSIGCAANLTNCTGKNNATDPAVVWPTEKNTFQRFNVVAKYYVDPTVVKQMGFVGNVTLKLRYTWEHNNMRQLGDQQFHSRIHRRRLTLAAQTSRTVGALYSSPTTTRITRRRSSP